MTERPTRCRARSLSLRESLFGTASTVPSWLFLEESGPWGADVPISSRLDPSLSRRLRALCGRLRIRVVLIRRVRRPKAAATSSRQCFLARTCSAESWVEHALLDDPAHVLDLDLAGLAQGRSPGLQVVPHPLYLVCTHGRHDPCCAEQGRPVAEALAAHLPEWTWEASHIGGDRFAANLLALPHGLYFGRVSPEEAVELADAYGRGEVDAHHLRGRAAYGFATQAAECFLRAETGIRHVDALPLLWSSRQGDESEAMFAAAGGGRYRVRVRTTHAQSARLLTCHAGSTSKPPEHRLVGLRYEPI